MPNTAITRHDLRRRREQLDDLLRYLDVLEAEHAGLLGQLLAFRARYLQTLGPLFLELDNLEAQLHGATQLLAEALRRQGIEAAVPAAPRGKTLPEFAALPARPPLPPEPFGPRVDLAPPSLKTLYRRAAMRLHPDLAAVGADAAERAAREQQMMTVNAAYADSDRAALEALLLAAGEDPVRVVGGQADALRHWLGQCEHGVQGRLRVVQAHFAALKAQPMCALALAIEAAEQRGGIAPFEIMASRLRSQIAERRQELYIGERLQANSALAADFVRRRIGRLAEG